MKITKLILHKYKRFVLNNITTLTYTPDAKIQLIAGTNGSGKSSLLLELSPLPANINKDYLENGYKEIYIEHNNHNYILTSGKEGKTKHSFKMDNVELNDGHTKKVQLTLVRQHFNITPEIHLLLIGQKSFTDMSINDRKQWLSSLSSVDYTYPISIFNKLKSRHRDITGALKILATKISSLEVNRLSKETVSDYINEYNYIQDIIYKLIENKENVSLQNTISIKDIEDQTYLLKTIYKKYDSSLPSTVDELNKQLYKLSIDIKEYNKKIETIKKRKEIGDLNKLTKELKDINNKIHDLLKTYKLSIPVYELDKVYIEFKSLYPDFSYTLNRLTEFSTINTDQAHINKLKDEVYIIENNLNTFKNKLSSIDKELAILEHNKNKKEVECNKCGNRWIDGFDLKKYEMLSNNKERLISKISELEDKLKKYKEELSTIERFENIFIPFMNFINERDDVLINFITDRNIDNFKEFQKIHTELDSYIKEIEYYLDIVKFYKTKKEILDKIEITKTLANIEITEDMEELEKELHNIYNEKIKIEKIIKDIDNNNAIKKKIKIIQDNLDNLLKQYRKELDVKIKYNNNDYYDNVILTYKELLTDLKRQIDDAEYANKNIDNLLNEQKELTKIKESLEYGLKALSPTEGLIAKSILSFLGVFTEAINNVIQNIWTYKMEILPPTLDDGIDLNYKFEVNIEDNDTIEDISKVSSGMKEVINLAHTIVAMHYLGLDHYPLYLDEYGARFDPVHRDKAYLVAKELSETYSQIFMITHSQDIYSLYPNSDIVILSIDNLFMSEIKEYNKKIKLE